MEKKAQFYETKEALESIAHRLEISHHEDMQDWAYEVADPKLIHKYHCIYDSLITKEEKFVMMQIMMQATNDLIEDKCDNDGWIELEKRLIWDYEIHKFLINYWSCLDSESSSHWWGITPLIRNLFSKQIKRKKILFICTVNRMRSATAHEIYKNDLRFAVKSAGTDVSANTPITIELLNWADTIIVMEKHHRNYIRKLDPDTYQNKKIVCLYIPDEYDYMQTELIIILRQKVESFLKRGLV